VVSRRPSRPTIEFTPWEQRSTGGTDPALEEFAGEEWADGEIARLTEIHAGTVDDLAASLIEVRRPAEAVALLEGQIARHPYRDSARGLMIRALAAAGRQADALRAFQRYRSVLIDEVGTEPSPEVVRIERRVATGWNGVEAPERVHEAGHAVVDLPLPGELNTNAAFVGRVEEIAELRLRLSRVATSGLGSVTVTGEAGIGKTALLSAFAREMISSRRATVAYGRCDETGPSLQAIRRIMVACVEHAPLSLLTAHVARHGGELSRICPALATRVDTTPAPTDSDEATERFLAFEAAADLLGRIASARPFVIMIDDVQFASRPPCCFCVHLRGALVDKPVLFVLALRAQREIDSDALRETHAELARGDTFFLQLDGLGAAELARLLATTERTFGEEATRTLSRKPWLTRLPAIRCTHRKLIRHWATPASTPTRFLRVSATWSGAESGASATRRHTCSPPRPCSGRSSTRTCWSRCSPSPNLSWSKRSTQRPAPDC
jgi:hypothetical protein